MPHVSRRSIRAALPKLGNAPIGLLATLQTAIAFSDLVENSSLNAPLRELQGRSVIIATREQLAAALAIVELDGVARRIVLWPGDLPEEHLPFVMETAAIDTIVSDGSIPIPAHSTIRSRVSCSTKIAPRNEGTETSRQTEWILLTSGTTGVPKLVAHTLDSLAGGIEGRSGSEIPVVWSTFYDIRRYGGLQIFLRAILTGSSLVLSDAHESTPEFLTRAQQSGVTHISGTPSHWRRALMSPAASKLNPRYVRLSGEIADQGILDQLRSVYPNARISHAFASTEAGLAFDVNDGLAGFPADLIGRRSGVELKVEDGSLRVRSSRTANRYLGLTAKPLADLDGFVDTGDMVALKGGRYYFAGRRDGVINVGGLKVHPEEVEAVVNHHPRVQMSLVRARKNPVTGAVVVADVVLNERSVSAQTNPAEMKDDLLRHCRNMLPAHKVPAVINFVSALGMAETGKLQRSHA
jgi:acyl-coenzyme A synthetase/AMP-(fatty) acid ligase